MTIDKAIANAREKAKEIRENIIDGDNLEPYESYCITMADKSAEEHKQLAEWLEELKVYQQHEIICNNGYNAGYNKAIDDFVKELQKKIEKDLANPDLALECKKCGIWKNYDIDEIAEQLKAGRKE